MRSIAVRSVAAALVVFATPSLAAAQVPVEDSVVGSGVGNVAQLPVSFEIDARSGPSGEAPAGTVRFVSEPFQIRLEGSVTCLRVSGHRAVIGMLTATGTAAFVDVTDGAPDLIGLAFPLTQPPTPCPAPGIQPGALPILSGDLVVTDAQPFPASKDECKGGGWRSFSGFKNQGDCVSFVATKGRNQPSGH